MRRTGWMLAGAVALAVGAPSGASAQGAPAPEVHIRKIHIRVKTGQDDLRKNSWFRMYLVLDNGDKVWSRPFNCSNGPMSTKYPPQFAAGSGGDPEDAKDCQALTPDSAHEYDWSFTGKLKPSQIHRFGIRFKTVNGAFQSDDNWDLTELDIEYSAQKLNKNEFVNGSITHRTGNPLHRFKKDDVFESGPLKL